MRHLSWQIALVNSLVVGGVLMGWTHSAGAQRRPIADDTLGSERSRVVPLDPDTPNDRIEGGARRGNNLFHSFREFHVDAGRGVYFADPGVENILGRVTGGTASEILGVLGVLGNANLFLINPSGIVFGSNAQLDVRGSFIATTADAVQFSDQGFFSATDPAAPPLLTVQPSAFLFNQLQPAPIVNNSIAAAEINPSGLLGVGLRVPEGERLILLGGNISMDGGGLTALGGRVEIGGLSQPGTVIYNSDGSLGFPIEAARADVLLNQALIDVAANGGGSLTINAGELEILDSFLSAGIGGNSGFAGAQAGDIILNADAIRGSNQSRISNLVGLGGRGNAGNIRITTGSLALTTGARLAADTLGRGNAGNVIINARSRVSLAGQNREGFPATRISSNVGNVGEGDADTIAVGNGGDIRITTGSLALNNWAELQAITYAQGNAGNVIINARDRVSLAGASPDYRSSIYSTVGAGNSDTIAVGNGGDIRITTGSLLLDNWAQLVAGTAGQGNAGNIILNARDRFSLTNGAQLTTTTFGQGNAGNVIINAGNRVVVDNAPIFSSVGSFQEDVIAVGNGGDIRIITDSLALLNGGQLTSATFRQGNAGNVTIHARDRVLIEGGNSQGFLSGIFTATLTGAQGRGGDVRIVADGVRLADGARISTETLNRFPGGSVTIHVNTFEAAAGGQVITATSERGAAGNIILNAANRITLSGVARNNADPNAPLEDVSNQESASGLYASTNRDASGRGGTIQITTDQLQVFDQARIAVNSQGRGVAGNMDITANQVHLDDQARLTAETAAAVDGGSIFLRDLDLLQLGNNSLISTTAGTNRAGGDGGNIVINADFIVSPNDNSDIRANAFTGRGGNVRITTEGLFGIAAQPQDNLSTSDITASSQQGVQGTIDIATPDTDPRRGLSELPVEVVDASDQITQTCSRQDGEETGEFVVTGRGGLPSSPIDSLTGDESLADWAGLDGEQENRTTPPLSNQEPKTSAAPIVEAEGWTIENGSVTLIAKAPVNAVQLAVICQ